MTEQDDAVDVVARGATGYPLPVADALCALAAADSLHERRDRVVECFRAALRHTAALALAARVQRGRGPAEEGREVRDMMRGLRSRGLTDGQWVGLLRGLCASWSGSEDAHVLPALARLLCGRDKGKVGKVVDGLLEMRKAETVAHGATGSADAIRKVLERREPQLTALFAMLEPVWGALELCVPLAAPAEQETLQLAYRLHGYTPGRGRWPRRSLAPGVRLPPGEVVLVDAEGRPRLSLHPIALFRRASPEAVEELFFLDGAKKNAALYVAFPSMAEHRENDAWSALGKSLLDGHDDEAPASARGSSRPYRGLASFGAEHAALFFGREEQAETLGNRIRRHPMVTVTGPSGGGKSSLLHAGVFPLLDMTVVTLRPGSDPLEALRRKLEPLLAGSTAPTDLGPVLADAPETLGLHLERFARERGTVVCVAVDQAEELFTLCHDEPARAAFGAALASIGHDAEAPCRVVVSLREDFFARLATIPALRGVYSRQVEVVATPDARDLVRVLTAPAALFGFSFEDEALVERMVEAVRGEPAALAMLQFCADQLWERRDRTWKRLTWDAYRAVGGVEGALAAHAEGVSAAMTPSQLATARSMLLRLVTEEGTRAVVAKADLVESGGARDDRVVVLDRLTEARLVTTREAGDGAPEAVELVHEALLRHWERLRRWLEEDEVFVRVRARLATAAARWDREGRAPDLLLGDGKPLIEAEELYEAQRDTLVGIEVAFIEASRARGRRTRRLKRGAVGALALLTALAGTFGAFAWQQRGAAEQMATVAAGHAAEAKKQEADASQRTIRLLTEQGRRELVDGKPLRALVFLHEARLRGGDEPALRAMLADATRPADALLYGMQAHDRAIAHLSWMGGALVTVTEDAEVAAFDGTAARFRVTALEGTKVTALVPAPDARRLALGTEDGRIAVVDDGGVVRLRLGGHTKAVEALAWGGGRLVSGGRDGTLRFFDATSGAAVAEHAGVRAVRDLAVSPDGTLVASGDEGGKLVLHRLADGSEDSVLALDLVRVSKLAFADADHLAVQAEHGLVLVGVRDGTRTPMGPEGSSARWLAVAPSSAAVASVAYDNAARVWESASGRLRATTGGHDTFLWQGAITSANVHAASFSPDGLVLLTVGSDTSPRLWDAATGHPLGAFGGHAAPVAVAAFHPDGTRIASADASGAVMVWSTRASRLAATIGRPAWGDAASEAQAVARAALAPDGEHVVTTSQEGATLWRGAERVARLEGARPHAFTEAVADAGTFFPGDRAVRRLVSHAFAAAWSPDGERFVADAEGGAAIYDLDGRLLARLGTGTCRDAAFGHDGVVVAGDGAAVEVWSSTGERRHVLAGHKAPIAMVGLSGDGRRIVTVDAEVARVWHADTGALVYTSPAAGDAPRERPRAALSADGSRLLLSLSERSVRVVSVPAGGELLAVEGLEGALAPGAERVLVIESTSATARIHTIGSTAPPITLDSHTDTEGYALARAFSGEALAPKPDGHTGALVVAHWLDGGTRIVTAGTDGTARLWDAASGRLLATLPAHRELAALGVGASAERLLTLGDGVAKLWDVHVDTRTAEALAPLVARLPFELVDGRIVPKQR
ncbi:MAG: hypothetical protein IT373_21830 [Polyangiaceae bacterium]|nr:hypothetical protein [Polyangiaceae bacterium]